MKPRELRVCCRELGRLGQHGRCRDLPFELHPDPRVADTARARLARFICDEHGRPIIVVPLGTFPRAVADEDISVLRGRC